MPLSAQPPTVITAAVAHRIGRKCTYIIDDKVLEQNQEDNPAQLMLTVDYSWTALMTLLIVEECSVFEVRRVLHDTNLGTDALSKSCSTTISLPLALRNTTILPLTDGIGAGLIKINKVVMLGESARDWRQNDVLKEALSDQSKSPVEP